MVIEDDADLMRLLTHSLRATGFEVVCAYGGEDALRKIKRQRPDLILTDLAMPKMSGVEVIEHVKGDPETRSIPCIAVTAYTWDLIARTAKEVGCDGFISKPFNAVRLRQEIAKYVPLPGTGPARSNATDRG